MKLSIKNFAKIKEANIVIDGITVIAGENNTGKSTVGKILFALFNSLSDIGDKIYDERLKEIESSNRQILKNYSGSINMSRGSIQSNSVLTARRIYVYVKKILDSGLGISENEIRGAVEKAVMRNSNSEIDSEKRKEQQNMIEEIVCNTEEILFLSEDIIVLEAISRYFQKVFHAQINSLSHNQDEEAVLNLEIKGREDKLFFANNLCKHFDGRVNITHKAVYIENPFIVDELSKYNDLSPMNELLKELLTSESKDGVLDGIIESVRAKEKLSDIYEALQTVVDGEIILAQDDEFYLKNSNFSEPISVHNLSTGVKAFVILKMLIEKGCLKEKDVLILDEPEIHLHPQWQVAYAELIVLLQKHFDLSIIVTTHSPYFMDAINLFSYKYGIDKKVNYYLSSADNDHVEMQLVTDNIDLIYKEMASPIQALDSLRYDLNNE